MRQPLRKKFVPELRAGKESSNHGSVHKIFVDACKGRVQVADAVIAAATSESEVGFGKQLVNRPSLENAVGYYEVAEVCWSRTEVGIVKVKTYRKACCNELTCKNADIALSGINEALGQNSGRAALRQESRN